MPPDYFFQLFRLGLAQLVFYARSLEIGSVAGCKWADSGRIFAYAIKFLIDLVSSTVARRHPWRKIRGFLAGTNYPRAAGRTKPFRESRIFRSGARPGEPKLHATG